MIPQFSKKGILSLIIISFFVILIFFFINNLIRSEKYIYYGDYSTYFSIFQNFSREFKTNNFLGALQYTSDSIRSGGDYNASIIIPLEILGVFNNSRLVFILSVYFIYYISSFFAFFHLVKFLSRKIDIGIIFLIGLLSMYFLSPVLLSPMLQGEPAIGGFLLIFTSIYLFFKNNNFSKKIYLINASLLGLCLSLLPILRRWYVFYIIAFLITIAADFGITFIKSKSKKTLLKLLINLLIVLVVMSSSFILFSGNLYQRFFQIGFGDLYSFFKYDNLFLSLRFVLESIGYLNITIFVISIFVLLKITKYRRIILFLLSILLISMILFLRTQGFSTHHLYLIMPIVFLIIGLGLVSFESKYKNYLIAIFILINIFSFVYATYLNRLPYWSNSKLFSTVDLHPLERTDLNELKLIFDFLGNTLSKNDTLYVLNSPNPVINPLFDGIFIYYCRDQYFEKSYICNQVLRTHLIDLLDGFPYHFFKADYVLIPDPIFNRRNQQVINKLVEFVNLSNNYKLINTLPGKEINVNIYKRTNNIPDNQINSLVNEFKMLYPNSIFDQQPPSHSPTPALQ